MKTKLAVFAAALFIGFGLQAQDMTAEEIINNYLENTGGEEAWEELEGIKMSTTVKQGGMEIPLEIVQLDGGKTYTMLTFQGQSIMQNVYDGTTLWMTNMQTGQPQKLEGETVDNMKLESNDFPDAILNYKDKGYTAELIGKDSINGVETYKVKLTKEPKTINGEKVEDVVYYYFHIETFVPLAQESEIKQGPMAGQVQLVTMSDYKEVDGLYFPFSMTQGIKGQPGQPVDMETIETNPEVDESIFIFPEGN